MWDLTRLKKAAIAAFFVAASFGLRPRLFNKDGVNVLVDIANFTVLLASILALRQYRCVLSFLGLRHIIPSVYRKCRIINGLEICEGWIVRKGKGNRAHARLAR